MFAVAHLDFTLLLWPYYVAVAAIYGTVAYLTKSILPSIALHTLGNTYSNFDLLFKGHTEWQTPTEAGRLIWSEGADSSFWIMSIIFLLLLVTSVGAYLKLAAIRKNHFIIE
ncbi:CPBP family intramembrane metalloprotease [Niabella defluvii]|nr:CPBP family intramembrane metalloprotease [Niabella sp. I65]